VPTKKACERFDSLRSLLAKMAEAQKSLDVLMGVPPGNKSDATSRKSSRPASPIPRPVSPIVAISPVANTVGLAWLFFDVLFRQIQRDPEKNKIN
jgi:hypothetical protein